MICASTGNTAASAAAYAARAGLRGAVIVPEGKIATGKLAQALMHGARVIALRGNFDEALALVRELADRHPIALVNSVNDFRIEGQKTGAFEVCDQLGEAPDVLCIPVGNAGNVTSWWKGFQEYGRAPRLHGYQAEGAAPLVHGAPVENPETVASAIRIGNPARWEDAMNAFTASRGEVRAVSDAEILDAYSLLGRARGRVLRAGLGGVGGRPAQVRRGGPRGLRAHRPRAEGPADRDEPGRSRGALRARHRERRAGGARVRRRRVVRVPASSANLGPGYDVLAAALSLELELEVEETGEFSVHCDVPGVPLDRSNLCVRAFERLHPADGLTLPDPLGDPGRGGTRVERRGDRGRAGRRRPHVRAGRAAVRAWPWSSRGIRTTSRPRCSAASWSAPGPARRRCGSTPRRGSRGCWRSRPTRCLRRRRGRRCRRRCRWRTPCTTWATPRCSCSGLAQDDFSLIGRGLRDLLHQPRRRSLYPRSMELVERAEELGAVGATISGAGPDRAVLVPLAADGQPSMERLKAEAPDCEIRRVTFAPGGADVSEL